MGKFAIGARVRDDDGDEGIVAYKDGKYCTVEYDSGIFASVKKKWLTPVGGVDLARAEVCKSDYSAPGDGGNSEWVPKVGDQVLIARNSRGHAWLKKYIGREFIISGECGTKDSPGWSFDGCGFWWPEVDLDLVTPTLPIGSTVTFTATGRLSAINENGHYQVTFPGLAPAQNSFALPAQYITPAN